MLQALQRAPSTRAFAMRPDAYRRREKEIAFLW
jgi:hypothetical protein